VVCRGDSVAGGLSGRCWGLGTGSPGGEGACEPFEVCRGSRAEDAVEDVVQSVLERAGRVGPVGLDLYAFAGRDGMGGGLTGSRLAGRVSVQDAWACFERSLSLIFPGS
jgi:hypothetical protein